MWACLNVRPDALRQARVAGAVVSAFAVDAVAVSVFLARNLRAVPDQEARVARELVFSLGDNLHYQFLGNEFAARNPGAIQPVGLIEFKDDAAGVRCISGLQCLK